MKKRKKEYNIFLGLLFLISSVIFYIHCLNWIDDSIIKFVIVTSFFMMGVCIGATFLLESLQKFLKEEE
jgi:hypothetical protein